MNVLVIPGFRKDTDSANLICVNHIVERLQKDDNFSIQVICDDLFEEKCEVSWKKHPLFAIRKVLNWPGVNPDKARFCFKTICDQIEEKNVDAIFVAHMPYDGVWAACQVKTKYPKIRVILYELDPITYEIDRQRNSLGRYLYFLRERAERRTFDICDLILHMECNRKKFENSRYNSYRKKFSYVDFPLISEQDNQLPVNVNENQKIKMVYSGRLNKNYRSPDFLLKVLEELSALIDFSSYFFSKGDCEDTLEEAAKVFPGIVRMGYVSKEELDAEFCSADFCLNIGNKTSEMLPSKLLGYIDQGIPIIHIQNQEKDACIPYLEKYPLKIVLNENEDINEAAVRLKEFVERNKGKRVPKKEVISTFYKNIPDYTANIIRNFLMK